MRLARADGGANEGSDFVQPRSTFLELPTPRKAARPFARPSQRMPGIWCSLRNSVPGSRPAGKGQARRRSPRSFGPQHAFDWVLGIDTGLPRQSAERTLDGRRRHRANRVFGPLREIRRLSRDLATWLERSLVSVRRARPFRRGILQGATRRFPDDPHSLARDGFVNISGRRPAPKW